MFTFKDGGAGLAAVEPGLSTVHELVKSNLKFLEQQSLIRLQCYCPDVLAGIQSLTNQLGEKKKAPLNNQPLA